MLRVINRIDECNGHTSGRRRTLIDVSHVVIHRFGYHDLQWWRDNGIDPTAEGISTFYSTNPEAKQATRGVMPYTFVVRHDGVIEQAHGLDTVTPHAVAFNKPGIGVACIGNFNLLPPSRHQFDACVDLVATLRQFWHLLAVAGHTSLTGATVDDDKVCPGHLFDLNEVNRMSRAVNETLAGKRMTDLGIVF